LQRAEQPSVDTRCSATEEAYVAVHSDNHELLLCDHGRVLQEFGVRLASGGVGKTREGDKRLPLGRYSLGRAMPSDRFGFFLPIGYPTAAQRARGMTGGAVGIHGPTRGARWLGRLVNLFDTTDGCVGLASDEEVMEIDRFVQDHHVTVVIPRLKCRQFASSTVNRLERR
jgi:murein L,D-transpeptidase YafK